MFSFLWYENIIVLYKIKTYDTILVHKLFSNGAFKVLNYTGEIKVSDNESKQLKFFSLDELPNMESRAKAIIDKIKNGKIKL